VIPCGARENRAVCERASERERERRAVCRTVPAKKHFALGRLVNGANEIQHRRLAAAARAEHDDELALADRDRDAAQRRNAFDAQQIGLVHVLHRHDHVVVGVQHVLRAEPHVAKVRVVVGFGFVDLVVVAATTTTAAAATGNGGGTHPSSQSLSSVISLSSHIVTHSLPLSHTYTSHSVLHLGRHQLFCCARRRHLVRRVEFNRLAAPQRQCCKCCCICGRSCGCDSDRRPTQRQRRLSDRNV
jgi:hypothetical protein